VRLTAHEAPGSGKTGCPGSPHPRSRTAPQSSAPLHSFQLADSIVINDQKVDSTGGNRVRGAHVTVIPFIPPAPDCHPCAFGKTERCGARSLPKGDAEMHGHPGRDPFHRVPFYTNLCGPPFTQPGHISPMPPRLSFRASFPSLPSVQIPPRFCSRILCAFGRSGTRWNASLPG
jgi:hypothetical protein